MDTDLWGGFARCSSPSRFSPTGRIDDAGREDLVPRFAQPCTTCLPPPIGPATPGRSRRVADAGSARGARSRARPDSSFSLVLSRRLGSSTAKASPVRPVDPPVRSGPAGRRDDFSPGHPYSHPGREPFGCVQPHSESVPPPAGPAFAADGRQSWSDTGLAVHRTRARRRDTIPPKLTPLDELAGRSDSPRLPPSRPG